MLILVKTVSSISYVKHIFAFINCNCKMGDFWFPFWIWPRTVYLNSNTALMDLTHFITFQILLINITDRNLCVSHYSSRYRTENSISFLIHYVAPNSQLSPGCWSANNKKRIDSLNVKFYYFSENYFEQKIRCELYHSWIIILCNLHHIFYV